MDIYNCNETILDLNKATRKHQTFIKNVKDSLPLGSWVAKLDLKDAYLLLPINQEYQPYLAFQWGMRFFQFQALPFGLSLAPPVFQVIMNFPLRKCRQQGISCLVFLDDWITWADSKGNCRENHLLHQKPPGKLRISDQYHQISISTFPRDNLVGSTLAYQRTPGLYSLGEKKGYIQSSKEDAEFPSASGDKKNVGKATRSHDLCRLYFSLSESCEEDDRFSFGSSTFRSSQCHKKNYADHR